MAPACLTPKCGALDRLAAGPAFCTECGHPLAGALLGPPPGFRVEEHLGSGYFAEVFRVVDLRSNAPFAAKIYLDDPTKLRAASFEIAALAALSHPRKPALHEAFSQDSRTIVVMELVRGPNLRETVSTAGLLEHGAALRLGLEVADLLQHVAEQGWTYRDLHPKNIHLDPARGAIVLDFDNARPPGSAPEPQGRIGYRAPELALGLAISSACDVFSLAGCLYFALTGDDPPEGAFPLARLEPGRHIDPTLASLLNLCRDADPANRPGWAELRRSLETLQAN